MPPGELEEQMWNLLKHLRILIEMDRNRIQRPCKRLDNKAKGDFEFVTSIVHVSKETSRTCPSRVIDQPDQC